MLDLLVPDLVPPFPATTLQPANPDAQPAAPGADQDGTSAGTSTVIAAVRLPQLAAARAKAVVQAQRQHANARERAGTLQARNAWD